VAVVAAFSAAGHEGPGSGAGGAVVGDVMVVPQWGHGPVTPASSLGTVRSMPQDWQLKWMTFGTELMSERLRPTCPMDKHEVHP
jgi:hypothetical protein